ncbi:endocuticle structural glycoprotein SgAbd-2-like [Palaemon carinicauda]|uniref:endocuticle structural glycoprotein SgAbd-2-like n=1 Tax=Palaemon carinicauda TaxID=392227 RepID=UPI0035B636D5
MLSQFTEGPGIVVCEELALAAQMKLARMAIIISVTSASVETIYRERIASLICLHIIFACLAVVSLAAPRPDKPAPSYGAPAQRSFVSSAEVPAILRDDRQMSDDASSYNFAIETEDGIQREEFGSAIDSGSAEGAVAQSGKISFTLPDGQQFEMTFVADENGFQPQSSFLPVAPEFPHPIPQFVLDQIEKARREDEEAARSAPRSAPSNSYQAP